jgi:glutamine amidotransferase
VKVTIFDYGAGNMHSLAKAVALTGAEVHIEADPILAAEAKVLVLPGVGAFGAAAARMAPGRSQIRAAVESGVPCLGICLGMQLLFESSEEGEGEGLAVFSGRVTRLKADKVPQIGWNQLHPNMDPLALSSGLGTAYFANAFVCTPDDQKIVTAWSEHGGHTFPSIVRRGNIVGTQFHPEKSSRAGLRFISNFFEECAR